MIGLSLQEPGLLKPIDCPEPPSPEPGMALVRVRKVGICGTDLHAYRGRQPYFTYPRILGHELGVEVVALGSDAGEGAVGIGDRCAVEPYLNCGECSACRRGKTNCCARLEVLGVHVDGGMRKLIQVPIEKLHASPKLKIEELALVETLSIGAHAVARAKLEPGEPVLVVGAGPIGLTVITFARLAGADVAVLELQRHRQEFCQRHLGVEHLLDGGNVLEDLRACFDGDLPTAVFDASGNPRAMEASFDYVEQGGRLTFVGLVQGELTFADPEFHRREMTLLSSRNATAADFVQVIDHMEAGNIDVEPWITHGADHQSITRLFPEWLQPENRVVKAMLDMENL